MSKASTHPRSPRPTGAIRRRAEAQRRRQQRNRRLLVASATAVLALVALLVALHLASGSSSSASTDGSSQTSGASLPVGTTAPDGTLTTLSGRTETVASLRGRPTLIWFVTTWCSSCQAGTQAMAQHVATLAADKVRVVEVENYADFGQSGPSMASFARALAGRASSNPDWTFGEASSGLTRTYNPKAYLDLYYLIDAEGKIAYVNSSPASTMPQLLSAAKSLA